MGRHKKAIFPDNNGTNSDTHSDSVPVSKKPKKEKGEKSSKKSNSQQKREKSSDTGNADGEAKKIRTSEVYSDSSSCSESDSEMNSVKNEIKGEKSVSDSNSESGSNSGSDSSDSSQENEPVAKNNAEVKPKNSVVNVSPVKRSYDPPQTPPKSSGSDSYHSDTEEEDKKRRKKQKELLKMQLNKKTNKRVTQKKISSFLSRSNVKQEANDESQEVDEDDCTDGAANNDEDIDWPQSDVNELIRRMEYQIPAKDNQKFDVRAASLNWENISFGEYTSDDCQEMWNRVSRRIRRHRNLSEVLGDAKEWASKSCTYTSRGSKKDVFRAGKDKTAERAGSDDMMGDYSDVQPTRTGREMTKGPIKPSTPFKLFCQDQLKIHGRDGWADKRTIEESAKEAWRTLNDEKKLVYINRSLADGTRFQNELKVYRLKNPDYVPPNSAKTLNKEERLIKERLAGKPVKPPNSAYSLFSKLMLQSDGDVKSKAPKLRMAEISKKWKELDESEKSEYLVRVRELKMNYKSELQAYLKRLTPEEKERELSKEKRKKKDKGTNKATKGKNANAKSVRKNKKLISSHLFKGEPDPPPVKDYDLFLEEFVADRPPGMSEEERLKQGPQGWASLTEAERTAYKSRLEKMKRKYIGEYEVFLKGLSEEELVKFSVRKSKDKELNKRSRVNGTLTDSNDESEDEKGGEEESSSEGSDSESEDSDKSKKGGGSDSCKSKSSSSSEDSDG